jgi:uncharacterized protein DUF6064
MDMNAPFTTEQFFDVFAHYNAGIWPAQYVLIALGVAVAIALFVDLRSSTVALSILAFLWLWMGLVYFAGFFAVINPAAHIFAIAFVVEALLLMWASVTSIAAAEPSQPQRMVAAALFAYALVIYPLLGFVQGQRYPASITFGLPCPTVIFTFGVLALLLHSMRPAVFIIPMLWAALGTVAALQLGVLQDFGLPIAAAATLLLALPWRAVARWKEAT